MPTNVYFDTGTTAEQRLYENLIIEQLSVFGQDVYYLPRKLVNEDTLFGEDASSSFNDAYIIEMYLDNIEGYEGQKEMMTRFGLDIQEHPKNVMFQYHQSLKYQLPYLHDCNQRYDIAI